MTRPEDPSLNEKCECVEGRIGLCAACLHGLSDPADRPVEEPRREIERLRAAILDIDAHATPLGEDKDGFVAGGYAISVGSLHRALALVGTAARKREHAVWMETEHGPACEGCEQVKHVALNALRSAALVPSGEDPANG